MAAGDRDALRVMPHSRRDDSAPRAVVDALPEAVLIFGPDGVPSLTNRAAHELFGRRPVRSFHDFLGRFGDLPPTPAIVGPVEVEIRDQPGRRVEVRLVRLPEIDATGAVVRDLTGTLHEWLDRDSFLGVLSHELRTPITTLYAGSSVLAHDDRLPAQVKRELAADIAAEAGRLFRVVEDLLALARLDAGGLDVTIEPVLLQRLVGDVVRTERGLWRDREIVAVVAPGLAAVAADPRVTAHVVRNLMANAARDGGAGSRVEIRVQPENGGVAVRARALPDAVEGGPVPDTRWKRDEDQADIGQVVVRRLVEAMGGSAWVSRSPDGSDELGFSLPCYPDEIRAAS